MRADDPVLIRAALAGDKGSLERLLRKYQNPVFALVLARLGNVSAAEEITQDVLVHAWQKLHQLRSLDRFPGWLRSITHRQCGIWLRSKRRESGRRALLHDQMRGRLSEGGRPPFANEDQLNVASMIAQLPESLRAAAVLCLERELSPSEAAKMLGLKPATLRKRLHDARAALQRRIVEKAEATLQVGLLPKDFAQRCVCRCGDCSDMCKAARRGQREGATVR